MIGIESQEVERKIIAILRIIKDSVDPVGARIVARHLQGHGIDLTERAVRYHLKSMDERGLTRLVGRDGRLITEHGLEELKSALVQDKVGFAISRIEILAFKTSFDWKTRSGSLPVNISLFPSGKFRKALQAMAPVFRAGLCAGDRIAVAQEGQPIGNLIVPEGKVGIATVCSAVVNGALLKAGVPMDSRFGGILQIRNHVPWRFVELIHYAGSSLDPSEVFIRGKMTAVSQAAQKGNGKILANFREIPAVCRPPVEEVVNGLKEAGLGALFLMGNTSESVCEIPIGLNRIGMILIGGMNPIAAAEEAGIEAENKAMSSIMDYQALTKFEELL
ncbi:MAG: NrpR regulatory domain-containing protein [Dehalococcoidia bacterium]|nr:NrpR regulatory domain-containing protein [Dehalococcoidia bacterium]